MAEAIARDVRVLEGNPSIVEITRHTADSLILLIIYAFFIPKPIDGFEQINQTAELEKHDQTMSISRTPILHDQKARIHISLQDPTTESSQALPSLGFKFASPPRMRKLQNAEHERTTTCSTPSLSVRL